MLPYFNILVNTSDKNNKMYSSDVPVKPRRKKINEVPIVHKSDKTKTKHDKSSTDPVYKTYSANFNSKKHKQLDLSDDMKYLDVTDDNRQIEENLKPKISKKMLIKENEKLTLENNELKSKIILIEDHLNKKNCKLKEKCNEIQSFNEVIVKENEDLKNQLQMYQSEIETYRNCQKCEEFTRIVEKNKKELDSVKSVNKEQEEDLSMLKNVIYR